MNERHRRHLCVAICTALVGLLTALGGPLSGLAAPASEPENEFAQRVVKHVDKLGLREIVARDARFRRGSGLIHDTEFIRHLYEDPSAADPSSLSEFHALLTPEESSALSEADKLAEAMDVIRPFVSAQGLGDIFGGAYMDQHEEGGVAHVGFVRNGSTHIEALRERFRFPGKLVAFAVEYSENELSTVVDRVSDEISTLEHEGITVHRVGVAVEKNVVEIVVEPSDLTHAPSLENRYGGEKVEVVSGAPLSFTDDRYQDNAPLPAGVDIFNDLGLFQGFAHCTVAWGLRDTTTDFHYRLTAGHCFEHENARDEWIHGDTTPRILGSYIAEVNRDDSRCDCGYFRLLLRDDGNYKLYLTGTERRNMWDVQRRDEDEVGNRVCLSAAKTDGICGNITDRYATVNVEGTILRGQRIVDFIAKKGDSGGPVYTGQTIKGVQSAGDGQNISTYSHVDYIKDYWPNKRVIYRILVAN